MNYLVIFIISFSIVFVNCNIKLPSYYNCSENAGDTLATSNAKCHTLDVNNTGICEIAAPVLERYVLEACNYTTPPQANDTDVCNNNQRCLKRCYWKYYSSLLEQVVCVNQRLLTGLGNGDLQYKLGQQLLTPCTVNGQQNCVGEYGYITCYNGNWSVSAICGAESSCEQYIETIGLFPICNNNCNPNTIQKARCSSLSNSNLVFNSSSFSTFSGSSLSSTFIQILNSLGFNSSLFQGRK